MQVMSDSWNHHGSKFGETSSLEFDCRVFLQDRKWLLDGSYTELATMTPKQLFRALEGLFCAAERHYEAMLQWYHSEYNYLLQTNAATGGKFLAFILDYQRVFHKTPHEWLRDTLLCQKIEELLAQEHIDG